MQLATPKGLRLHIAIFGRTNVGKSSFLNCLTQQEVSIVSDLPGTTTDPVEKPMELLPIGPVLFIDTAGLDDISTIGNLRIEKTLKVFERADLVILVTEANKWTEYEDFVISKAQHHNTPVLVVLNKTDILKPDKNIKEDLEKRKIPYVEVSSKTKNFETTSIVKSKLIEILPQDFITPPPLIPNGILKKEDFAILVIPIDKEAPKGRIILPQQQVLREILDLNANALVTNEKNLKIAIDTLKVKPKIVITDSQAFEEVLKTVPEDVYLTSFSILFAANKGDIKEFIESVYTIDKLQDNDKILIAESCTHHPIGDDIGRHKIPRWIKERTKKEILVDVYSGKDFPDNLKEYKLIIQCGGCMMNRKEILSRVYKAKAQNVPITNYGIAIAYLKGGLERTTKIFNHL
ncbi:MAG: [FeFe] hydrogenase H-cluster maturation GTPase HydF [Endomicrobiia bacterium]